jgi:hypothetical protein
VTYRGAGTVRGPLHFVGTPFPGISVTNEGRIYFDSASGKFKASENGGAYVDLVNPATAGGWTDDGTVVRLTTVTDQVGIGTATPAATAKLEVDASSGGFVTAVRLSGGGTLRFATTATPTVAGDLGCTVATGRITAFTDSAARDLAYLGEAPYAETDEYIPQPEAQVTTNSTRVAQTTYDGASFALARRVTFNRLILRLTAVTGTPTLSVLIYQAAQGGSGAGATSRVATCSLSPVATGTFTLTPAEGTVTLLPGLVFVLIGRSSAAGSATFRTYTVQTDDLLNANVDVNTHPVSFTTTISATTNPATFDPRATPTGQATPSALDTALLFRLRNV